MHLAQYQHMGRSTSAGRPCLKAVSPRSAGWTSLPFSWICNQSFTCQDFNDKYDSKLRFKDASNAYESCRKCLTSCWFSPRQYRNGFILWGLKHLSWTLVISFSAAAKHLKAKCYIFMAQKSVPWGLCGEVPSVRRKWNQNGGWQQKVAREACRRRLSQATEAWNWNGYKSWCGFNVILNIPETGII